jgi:hypothetical protein
MNRIALLAVLVLAFSGCASILAGKQRSIPFRSDPPGAEVLINGHSYGPSPVTLRLRHGETYHVTFRLDGYRDQTYVIPNTLNGGWVVLDFVCGVFPVLVDAITGDWKTLRDGRVVMDMRDGIQPEIGISAFGDTIVVDKAPKVRTVKSH